MREASILSISFFCMVLSVDIGCCLVVVYSILAFLLVWE